MDDRNKQSELHSVSSVSNSTLIVYIVLHLLWITVQAWFVFEGRKDIAALSGEEYEESLFGYRFSLGLLALSVYSLVLILIKKRRGWWCALITLIIEFFAQICFIYQSRTELIEVIQPETQDWFDILLSVGLLASIVLSIALLPGLMIWMMWHHRKRGVFSRDGA